MSITWKLYSRRNDYCNICQVWEQQENFEAFLAFLHIEQGFVQRAVQSRNEDINYASSRGSTMDPRKRFCLFACNNLASQLLRPERRNCLYGAFPCNWMGSQSFSRIHQRGSILLSFPRCSNFLFSSYSWNDSIYVSGFGGILRV